MANYPYIIPVTPSYLERRIKIGLLICMQISFKILSRLSRLILYLLICYWFTRGKTAEIEREKKTYVERYEKQLLL